jgi:hypothetical protein
MRNLLLSALFAAVLFIPIVLPHAPTADQGNGYLQGPYGLQRGDTFRRMSWEWWRSILGIGGNQRRADRPCYNSGDEGPNSRWQARSGLGEYCE